MSHERETKGGVILKFPKLVGRRKELGISQREMATRLGISTGAYSLKERGKRDFKIDEISFVLLILGSKYEDIFLSKMSHK